MIKIQFDQPLPHCYRDKLIYDLRDLGFKYDRIFQNGDYALFRFYGRLPTIGDCTTISLIYESDDLKQEFTQVKNQQLEITFFIERN